MYQIHTSRRQFSVLLSVAAVVILSLLSAQANAQNEILTQDRINDVTASVLESHLSLEGQHAAPLPGETETVRKRRLEALAAQMDRALVALKIWKGVPDLRDTRSTNTARWKRIVSAARRLVGEVAAYRAALKQTGAAAGAEKALTTAHKTIWNIYSELRDARP